MKAFEAVLVSALAVAAPCGLHAQVGTRIFSQTRGKREDGPSPRHFTVSGGAGGTVASGTTSQMMGPGFIVTYGLGYSWNRRVTALLNMSALVNPLPDRILSQEGQPAGTSVSGVFTIDPMFNFIDRDHFGAYVTGGAGISIKQVRFTHPSPVYTYGYGYNALAASEASTQPAIDFGGGITLRRAPEIPGRIFLEARYLRMFTPKGQFPGFNNANNTLVPISIGWRW